MKRSKNQAAAKWKETYLGICVLGCWS